MVAEDEFREVEEKIHSIYLQLWDESAPEGSVDQYASCSHYEKVFSLIFYLIGEVENGGFSQWIGNPMGHFVRETYDALLEIGAIRVAELVAYAMAMFPEGCPAREYHERYKQVREVRKKDEDALNALDDPFGDERRNLHILLLKYWEANVTKPQES